MHCISVKPIMYISKYLFVNRSLSIKHFILALVQFDTDTEDHGKIKYSYHYIWHYNFSNGGK